MSDEKNLPATIDPFTLMQRQARAYAGSTLVPESMRTFENALAAMMMADEMGESRLAVMQNLFFIAGRPGWITSFMIGRANRAHKFKGPLRWRTKQKDEGNIVVECYGKLPDSEDEISVELDLATAIKSGWTTYKDRNDHNKIKTHARWDTPAMIEQMLRWRTAAWLIRLYTPETMMGLPTKEELEDLSGSPEMIDVTPVKPPTLKEFTEADRRASYERAGVPLEQDAPSEPQATSESRQPSVPSTEPDVEPAATIPQNPEDRPPARPPTALSSADAAASPTPAGASDYALPMVMKNGKPDLRAWALGRLLPALLKAERPEVVAWTIGDNHKHIEAYKATLPPLERSGFEGELKNISEEVATHAEP